MKYEYEREYVANLVTITETLEPSLYQVVVHNDDFTPMEFVVAILERFFFMDRLKAVEIMMEVHTLGRAICGIFSKDVAESKVADITEYSRMHEHPLFCSVESGNEEG